MVQPASLPIELAGGEKAPLQEEAAFGVLGDFEDSVDGVGVDLAKQLFQRPGTFDHLVVTHRHPFAYMNCKPIGQAILSFK